LLSLANEEALAQQGLLRRDKKKLLKCPRECGLASARSKHCQVAGSRKYRVINPYATNVIYIYIYIYIYIWSTYS